MSLAVGSLFSGIEGFGYGFEQAGCRIAWQVEIDPDCQKVLRRHYPDVPLHSDVQTVGAHNLAPVDVITFGSPCQDLSVAGQRAGLNGARSGLFFEALRIVGELRPALVLFENVPGLLSSHAGGDFAAALSAFRELGARDICWRIIDAQHTGVPQRRRRVFLVADFAGERAAEILLEPACSFRHPPQGREARPRIAATLTGGSAATRGVSRAGRRSEDDVKIHVVGPLQAHHGGGRPDVDSAASGLYIPILEATARQSKSLEGSAGIGQDGDPMFTLQAGNQQGVFAPVARSLTARNTRIDGDTENFVCMTGERTHALTSEGGDASEDGTGRGTPVIAFHMTQDPISGDVAPAQSRGNENGCATVAVATWDRANVTSASNRTRREYGLPSNTLHSEALSIVSPQYGVRRLMPIECERLMGFPDYFTAYGDDGKPISDSARYRMLGNSIVTTVSAWIARRVVAALDTAEEAAS